ncbi:MAG: hypothetical protein LC631_00845, partial [Desulfovibrionales bacterium]|nr:hypothetical protein [Desulfovibrionales bacterium]
MRRKKWFLTGILVIVAAIHFCFGSPSAQAETGGQSSPSNVGLWVPADVFFVKTGGSELRIVPEALGLSSLPIVEKVIVKSYHGYNATTIREMESSKSLLSFILPHNLAKGKYALWVTSKDGQEVCLTQSLYVYPPLLDVPENPSL